MVFSKFKVRAAHSHGHVTLRQVRNQGIGNRTIAPQKFKMMFSC